MKHNWKLSYKGYKGGNLESLTYFCNTCTPYHFKEIQPGDTKFIASTYEFSKVAGSWERRTNVERQHYEKDTLQPYRKDGTVNEKFMKAYGKEAYKNWGESNPQVYKRKSF